MKKYSWLFLSLLPLLAGCPKKQTVQEAPRDYESVKQHADKASHDVDKETGAPSEP